MPLITGPTLKNVVPTLAPNRAIELADDMDFILPKYGIDCADILHEFIANIAHESGAFRIKCENLNYHTAERLMKVWPTRFKTKAAAAPYVNQPVKLANLVYGGRMGNTRPNDGWDMRGGGFAGLTGRDMYQKYAKYWDTDIMKVVDMVRNDDYWALDSAAWFFAVEKKLIPLAKGDNLVRVVKPWNGGLIGLHDRQYYYDRAKRYIK